MRNEPLTGYVLHQKPYGESRSLIYFFSQEYGLVHGIGKKNLPLFMPISLFATGKNSLKTFSQSQILYQNHIHHKQDFGKNNLAGLYLNELLLKLFGIANVENETPQIWQYYQDILTAIFSLNWQDDNDKWRLHFALRQFETVLLAELGYAIDFEQDCLQNPIEKKLYYEYQLEKGFMITAQPNNEITGEMIIDWQNLLNSPTKFELLLQQDYQLATQMLLSFGRVYRLILDNLLQYQPLKSRELWQQLVKYQ